MLYTIYGNNTEVVKKKQHEVLDQLRAKRPNANFVVLDSENFSEGKLDELVLGGGLFDEKHIVSLNNLFSDKQFSSVLSKKIEEMEQSISAFISVDPALDAKLLKEIEKHAYKVVKIEKREAAKRDDRNVLFGIADMVGARNGVKAWALFQKALKKDFSAEEIHGTLFWQMKSIALAKDAKSAKEAGLSPFVYSKSINYAKNFSTEELHALLHGLVAMYHESRTENGEAIGTALEKPLLSL